MFLAKMWLRIKGPGPLDGSSRSSNLSDLIQGPLDRGPEKSEQMRCRRATDTDARKNELVGRR